MFTSLWGRMHCNGIGARQRAGWEASTSSRRGGKDAVRGGVEE